MQDSVIGEPEPQQEDDWDDMYVDDSPPPSFSEVEGGAGAAIQETDPSTLQAALLDASTRQFGIGSDGSALDQNIVSEHLSMVTSNETLTDSSFLATPVIPTRELSPVSAEEAPPKFPVNIPNPPSFTIRLPSLSERLRVVQKRRLRRTRSMQSVAHEKAVKQNGITLTV
ncbi:hypothetical protein EST38_g7543 [Candolleomyces aberdarensis]|uniref:Uncharacterized protein n=1 Tax=Candolleomyces aberdarensis TaxID=2316362 RepID=A0A4Q2DGM7_9AGAR|nr:hypothetical protein EST38_g7543 [Candolleomyces aberdarensis]